MVITLASHARGLRFEPGQEHVFIILARRLQSWLFFPEILNFRPDDSHSYSQFSPRAREHLEWKWKFEVFWNWRIMAILWEWMNRNEISYGNEGNFLWEWMNRNEISGNGNERERQRFGHLRLIPWGFPWGLNFVFHSTSAKQRLNNQTLGRKFSSQLNTLHI